jgi:hypothetical protein
MNLSTCATLKIMRIHKLGVDSLMNWPYNGDMSKQPKPDWSKRKSITLPADLAEFVTDEADARHVPAYWLVTEAVKLYIRVNPLNGNSKVQ